MSYLGHYNYSILFIHYLACTRKMLKLNAYEKVQINSRCRYNNVIDVGIMFQ